MKLKLGIFGKMFLYTLCFLIITVCVTALLFAGQFKEFYDYSQKQVLAVAFNPLLKQIEGKSPEEIHLIIDEFHRENPQYEFSIVSPDIKPTYYVTTDATDVSNVKIAIKNPNFASETPEDDSQKSAVLTYRVFARPEGQQVTLTAFGISAPENRGYKDIIIKLVLELTVLVAIGILGAALLARGMTNPIKRLAAQTRQMSELMPVDVPPIRYDELGQLERDVHNMYDKLKYTISELESEKENQRYFFSAASHELKTPIAAISALLEGMLANVGEYKNHSKYLRECIKMTKGQNKIISEILEIVNLSGSRLKMDMKRVNLCEMLESTLSEHKALAENAGIKLETDIPADSSECVADSNMLGRVVSNVVMNAVQNTPQGGKIRIWSARNGDKIRLLVLNTNACIDEETAKRLFEPFYRADKARSRAQERSGLGLSIVKKMLEKMDVPFALENSEGTGVVFYMDLEPSESEEN